MEIPSEAQLDRISALAKEIRVQPQDQWSAALRTLTEEGREESIVLEFVKADLYLLPLESSAAGSLSGGGLGPPGVASLGEEGQEESTDLSFVEVGLRLPLESSAADSHSSGGLGPAEVALTGANPLFVGKDIGPFAVEKELGSGAMGTVYLARYEEKGRHVALKFMSPGLSSNPNATERFEREFDILKQLRHPNIVRLIATGKYQKLRFYAMEFIEGESLDRVLARRGKLPWQEVVALGKQLCAALQHAHQQGIIHRDLKPSNLMIARDGTLKLTDFGLAKDVDAIKKLTATDVTVGTAAYMSPEQCQGERKLSHKCDLYSLGIVFYELLTGAKPYAAENVMDMFLCHVKGRFERPSRREMDIPVWLDLIVCHLLVKDPQKRPYDAAKVAEALDQVAEKVAAHCSRGAEVVGNKKGKPIYVRALFRILGVAALLLCLWAMNVVSLLPPTAESLFEEAKKVMGSKDADKIDRPQDDATGALFEYLKYYGNRDDKRTDQVWEWVEQIASERRRRANADSMGQ